MRTHKLINAQKFWEIWREVLDLINEDGCILVEGVRDKFALENLLVEKNIIVIQENGVEKTIEELNHSKAVLILTDFDKEGEKIADKICKRLEEEKIRVHKKLRSEIRKVLKPISQIEDIKHVKDYLIEQAPFYIYWKKIVKTLV